MRAARAHPGREAEAARRTEGGRRVTMAGAVPGRVLMTADALGEIWSYSIELARGLIRSGCEVVLAATGPPPTPEQQAAAARIGAQLLHAHHGRDLDAAAVWLLDLEERFDPDLVHLNGVTHAALPWRAPTLVVAHAVNGTPPPANSDADHRRIVVGLRAADLVVAPTRAVLDEVQAAYGPLARTRWISNGCGPRPNPTIEKGPLFFSVGRAWDEGREVGALAAVAERLPWPLCIAGAGSTRGSAVRWLKEVSAEAMQHWYARASVFILPCRCGSFGFAALEAGLAGCALVLADTPALREIWDGAALFVPPGDALALASTLSRVATDPKLLWLLGGRARCRAEPYSAARMTAGYLEAYADVLAAQRRASALAG